MSKLARSVLNECTEMPPLGFKPTTLVKPFRNVNGETAADLRNATSGDDVVLRVSPK